MSPEDWPRSFAERVNAGDVEGAMSLYEPEARFVTPQGELVIGVDAIERNVARLAAAKARMQPRVVRAVAVGDLVLLYTDWQVTSLEPSGKTVERASRAIELLRRSADGRWLLIVGDPNGRA